MWKDRAVALVSAIMPCLVYKRDSQNLPLNIGVVRTYLVFKAVIKLSRDRTIPERLRTALVGYLNELPGYVDSVFDDEGNEKPQSPDAAPVDTSTPRQQHGYLSMQFTRSMSSLGEDYGFIFDTPAADVDMLDVVLNRRILIALIPALEKSGEETANLGKIIASTLKGMMGQTLGSTVEGNSATVIENKPTTASTPFMAIFDEVGYYVAQGMAVMAAQARSLGFSLVFSSQDMAALEKRVKEEARSITANCNIKLFGKLEDPGSTKEFFEKTVGTALVTEVSGFERSKDGARNYYGTQNASIQGRARASYDGLKGFIEGRAVCSFGSALQDFQIYNSDIGHAKAMRIHRFLPIPPPSEEALASLHQVDSVLKRLRDPQWNPEKYTSIVNKDIVAMEQGFSQAQKEALAPVECGVHAIAAIADAHGTIKVDDPPPDAVAPPPPLPDTMPPASIPGARRPPLPPHIEAAEKAAAAAVAKTARSGPLNWGELIGVTEPQAATISPPAAAAPLSTETPAAAKPFTWGDLVSGTDTTPPVTAPAEEQKTKMPISWADVIGAAPEKDQE